MKAFAISNLLEQGKNSREDGFQEILTGSAISGDVQKKKSLQRQQEIASMN